MRIIADLDQTLNTKIIRVLLKASLIASLIAFLVYLSPLTKGGFLQFLIMLFWLVLGVGTLYKLYVSYNEINEIKYYINAVFIVMINAIALTLQNPEIFAMFYFIMAFNVSFRDRTLHFISSGVQLFSYLAACLFFPILLPAPTIEDSSASLMITKLTIFLVITFFVDILNIYSFQLTNQLINQEKELTMTALNDSVGALVHALEAKDQYTNGHSQRTSKYALCIASQLNLIPIGEDIFTTAGLLHDIGKIGIPDSILGKNGPLTPEEYSLIKEHPLKGAKILGNTKSLQAIIPMILYHHERFDGKGYPHGIKGEEIPLEARILAVADSFDAMTSSRPYRLPMTPGQAYHEVINQAGKQFCPQVVLAFIEAYGAIYQIYTESHHKRPS